MDYRKAWEKVRSQLEQTLDLADICQCNTDSNTFSAGAYHAYKRTFTAMVELESEIVSKEIEIGDTVRIENPAACYPNYREWIVINIDNPFLATRWAVGRSPSNRALGVVRHIAPHGTRDVMIAYVQIGNACYMVDVAALEKIVEN